MRAIPSTLSKAGPIAILLSLVAGLSTVSAATKPGTLLGRTVDFDGKAVKKVSVVLTSPDDPSFMVETTSDKNGAFEIGVDDTDVSFDIRFERRGFVVMKTFVDIKAGQPTERTFTMLTQQDVDEGKGEIVRQREIAANADPAVDLYNEGVAAFQAGDLAEGRSLFEQALEHNNTMAPALAALAVIAMQQQDWAAAAKAAERTLAIDPTDTRALFAAYRANTALGNVDLATQAADSLKAHGGNVDAAAMIFNQGAEAYRAHDVAEATALFSEAVVLDPTLTDAFGALAAIYLSEGRFEQANEAAQAALEVEPDNQRALKVRFEAALAQGSDTLALAMSDLAAIDGEYVSQSINKRAFDLFEINRFTEAQQLAELLLAIDPDDARANYTLGLILVNAGDNDDARDHLQKFVNLTPDDPDAEGVRLMLEALQ